MLCTQCGEEMPNGSYFCASCGRPVGYRESGAATAVDEPGLSDVPSPIGSMERPAPVEQPHKKALCSVCLGAYPVEELSVVDGNNRCADCSTVRGGQDYSETGRTGDEVETPYGRDIGFSAHAGRHADFGGRKGNGAKVVLIVLLLALIGGGVYLLLTGMGSDRIDKMLAGVDDGREDALLLVQKFEPGVPLNYKVGLSMEMEISSDDGNEMTFDVSATQMVVLEPLSVDEDGNAELRLSLRIRDIALGMSVNGEKVPVGDTQQIEFPGAVVLRMRVDPFGQPIGGLVVESVEGPSRGASDPSTWNIVAGLDQAPRHRVKVGDTWTNNATFPFGGGAVGGEMATGDMGGSATMTVEGFKKVLGRDCMAMSLDGSMEGSQIGGPLGAMFGNVSMEGTIKGAVFFDPEAGVLVKQAIDLEMDVSGSGPGGAGEIRGSVRIDLELQ